MVGQDEDFLRSLFNSKPQVELPLDPGFRPLALGVRNFRQALAASGQKTALAITLEQDARNVARLDLEIFATAADREWDNLRYVSWMVNGLLWSRGGWRLTVAGPRGLCEAVAALYAPGATRPFEREIMALAFARPLEVRIVEAAELPQACRNAKALGGHLEGYRLGFDLGASDFKVTAVKDGEVVFSTERPWNPKVEPDPEYHYRHLNEGLKLAASFLPRVDAIGGSSAGIILNNEIRVSSLFRAVPEQAFESQVRPFFLRLQKDWGVPLEVINDGDVTALAGGLSLEKTGILGIALGSSEAAGFLDETGRITGWLNELAFGPVDANPEAGADDWSLNPGVGAAYFSQQAVDRLAKVAGLRFTPGLDLPERLKAVQELMAEGSEAAAELFATIGAYLGYTLPWYAEFYPLDHAMILGRVTSGPGGALILATAKRILASEFPELATRVSVFLPDEHSRRVGQAVAAASLPAL